MLHRKLSRLPAICLSLAVGFCGIAFAQANGAGGFPEYSIEEARYLIRSVPDGFSLENKVATPIPDGQIPTDLIFKELFPCNAGLQAMLWDKLTTEERMLVWGYEELKPDGSHFEPPRRIMPVTQLGSMLSTFYQKHGRLPVDNEELYLCLVDMINKSAQFDSSINRIEAIKNALERMKSPVTGKLIEWNHEGFSPGNAFITNMNDNPDQLSAAAASFNASRTGRESEYFGPYPDSLNPETDMMFVNHRAYGYSGVLQCWVGQWQKTYK